MMRKIAKAWGAKRPMTVYTKTSSNGARKLVLGVHELCRKEMVMKRTILLLIALATAGCASNVRTEQTDNPRITPTSITGVTSSQGQNVYEKIPLPAKTAR